MKILYKNSTITAPSTERTTLLFSKSNKDLHTTDALFQVERTLTWMLYRVLLGQKALYKVRQGLAVFLHTPPLGSSSHRVKGGDVKLNDTITGKVG